jgi:hypothetical protein
MTPRTDDEEFNARLDMHLSDLFERLSEYQTDRYVSTQQVSRWLADRGYTALIDPYENWISDHLDDDLITELNGEDWMPGVTL